MNQIQTCTNDLIQAILNSEEYLHFCEIRDLVAEEENLREQINAFRQHVFETRTRWICMRNRSGSAKNMTSSGKILWWKNF